MNQDLVGDGLGNFHVDFSMGGAFTEIYGVESLLLCNKHIDILESTDNDGNTINAEHIRCRGIPTSCITYKASQDKTIVWDIHNDLYKGQVIDFDLITQRFNQICLQK